MIQNIKDLLSNCRNFKKFHKAQNIYIKQSMFAFFILLIIISTIWIFSLWVRNQNNNDNHKLENNPPIKIEVASQALDPEKMWRNHFEEKLTESDNIMKKQLDKISEAFHIESEETRLKNKNEISELKEQLITARNELRNALNEIIEMKNKQEDSENNEKQIIEQNISLTSISDEQNISDPKDNKLYIPETAYVSGLLLGGIAVSTSIGSPSEPVPVIIRITDKGNLPANFSTDLKQCRILGSGYGDLSSERAVIRAEVMICQNNIEEEIITTKIAGLIYGDDGMNGIKGRVVDMSIKHIKNAAIGGILSGFANTMKAEGDTMLSAFGTVSTHAQSSGEKLRNNSLAGIGSAAEKIADYYIKKAENMSPILLIPGGTKVDVIFTKGVYLGGLDIRKKIHSEMR